MEGQTFFTMTRGGGHFYHDFQEKFPPRKIFKEWSLNTFTFERGMERAFKGKKICQKKMKKVKNICKYV